MASGIYTSGKLKLMNGTIDWDGTGSTGIRMMLVSTGYTFAATHNYVSQTTGTEISVAGYSRQSSSSKTVAASTARIKYDMSDVTYSSLTAGQTVGAGIIYKDAATDTGRQMLFYMDVTNTPTNGGNITVQFSSLGIYYVD